MKVADITRKRFHMKKFIKFLIAVGLALCAIRAVVSAATVTANFTSATTIPVTAAGYTATGNDVSLSLGYAPTAGTSLMVVKNTGPAFIIGGFNNLVQGQAVSLTYNSVIYSFIANYYGGSGNDLVLQWASVRTYAWGQNDSGELGNNSIVEGRVPSSVITSGALNGKTVTAIAAGSGHSLALCSDGTLVSWGDNSIGQLGNGNTTNCLVPVSITSSGALSGKSVIAIAAGALHSLALCSDGSVAAWGYNSQGQLGDNTTTNSTIPVVVSTAGALNGKTATAIAAGFDHSLAICSDGTLAFWGSDSANSSLIPINLTELGVLRLKTIVAIAAGGGHSLALCSDGTLAAFGANNNGELGYAEGGARKDPVAITSSGILAGKTVVSICAGYMHSLALCTDGTIAAWGRGGEGQLGNGSSSDCNVPVAVYRAGVLSGNTVNSIASGAFHSYALCSNGTLAAWGLGSKLGNDTNTSSNIPVTVSNSTLGSGEKFMLLSAGSQGFHSMALTAISPSNNSKLSSLALSSGILSPAFLTGVTNYSASVANDIAATFVTPTVADSTATVTVNGVAVTSGNASASIPLVVGTNTITVLVTAEDGTTTTYIVTITRISTVCTLSNLTLSAGTLSPTFAATTSYYTASVPNATTSITPTVTDVTATIKVNGMTVASGTASQSIVLVAGLNTINVEVTAQDGTTTKIYTVMVTISNVATLSGLTLNSGILSPAFAAGTTSYAASVPNATTSITVAPTLTDSTATIKVNGATVATGSASRAITLAVGSNTITTVVTAQDGVTTKTYTVTVTRISNVSTLSGLLLNTGRLSPTFAAATTSYTTSVSNATSSITVTPHLTDSTATIKVNGKTVVSEAASGSITLAVGPNTVTTVVTAQDGITTSIYTVTITRFSANASLGALAISAGTLSPTFAPGVLAYTSSVSNATTTFTVTPSATHSAATVKVNGASVTSSSASAAIPLAVGTNVITVQVTAQDVSFNNSYTVTVTRPALNATFASATTVPLTLANFTNPTNAVNVSLGYAPTVGTNLTLVENTGLSFITGKFSNLAQGQMITLGYNNASYRFVVNYYGGTGNDLVFQWANDKSYAWGSGIRGQLGQGTTNSSNIPGAVTATGVLSGKMILSISTGSSHSLALCSDGTVAAWGYNLYGQLGNGGNTDTSVPVAVTQSGVLAGKTVVAVSAGFFHSLALCSDGTVAAWGYNLYGQLGNGSTTSSNVPVLVTTNGALSGKVVTSVVAGYYHNFALCADGTVVAWGRNSSGQLGNNSIVDSSLPVDITTSGTLNGRSVVTVAAGSDHSLVLCLDGSLVSWGKNANGQLGNGSTTSSLVPQDVDATDLLAPLVVEKISAGGFHNLATCSDGTLVTFGRNTNGQLGNNSNTDSTMPAAVTLSGTLNGKEVIAIQAANAHSMALCTDGTIASWGMGSNGILGNGGTANSNVPVAVTASGISSGEKFIALAGGSSASHSMALVAVPPLTGYEAWTAIHADLSDSTALGDPDKDGIPNVLEYALNGNPTVASAAILPMVSQNAGSFQFSFSRAVASVADTTQVFQYSTDLNHWTELSLTPPTDARVTLGPEDGAGIQPVTVTIPKQGDIPMFGRLKVVQP